MKPLTVSTRKRLSDVLIGIPPSKLAAFIPKMVGLRLNRERGPEDGMHKYTCAMVFVDVSGFSEAASRLNELSDDGAELISCHLNKYFTSIIDIIYDHGGDIILFSGDAILASWWQLTEDCTEENIRLDSEIALNCATALLSNAGNYKIKVNDKCVSEMGLHIALSQGEAYLSILGGTAPLASGRWLFLLHGTSVQKLGLAIDRGKKGQLIVCKSIINILSECDIQLVGSYVDQQEEFFLFKDFDARPEQTSALNNRISYSKDLQTLQPPPAEPAQNDINVISSLVFDTLIFSANTDSHGQLRTVSVVFIKLCQPNYQSDSVETFHKSISESVNLIQKNLARVDGVLNKVVMDDKGVHCLCLFGIPHHCHSDDAERSVIFSYKMSARLRKIIGPTSIGIGRAVVYCGMTGSSKRAEYTVLGDGVNIAARLMELGDGEKRSLLCGTETCLSVQQGRRKIPVEFVAVGEYTVKGKDKPVFCYQIVSETDKKEFESIEMPTSDTESMMSLSTYRSCSSFDCGTPKNRVTISPRSKTSVRPFSLPCTPRSRDSLRLLDTDDQSYSTKEIYCRQLELKTIRSFCDCVPFYKPITSRSFKGSLGPCLIITGGYQCGKSLLLKRATEMLKHPPGWITHFSGIEEGHSNQFGSIQRVTNTLLTGTHNQDGVYSVDSLQLLSFIVRHEWLSEPTPDQLKVPLVELLDMISVVFLELLLDQVSNTLIITVDDIHCLDPASLRVLLNLNRMGVTCIFTGGHQAFEPQPEGTDPRRPSWASSDSGLQGIPLPNDDGSLALSNYELLANCSQGAIHVELTPFSIDTQVEFLGFLLNAVPEPILSSKLIERLDGVPGLLVSALRHLLREDVISVVNGVACLAEGYNISEQIVHWVEGYEATVYRELDLLPDSAVKALHICSVLGVSFDGQILRNCLMEVAITKRFPDHIISQLLQSNFLVSSKQSDPVEMLSFQHPLSRDAVYLAILSQERRGLHALVESVLSNSKYCDLARIRANHCLQSALRSPVMSAELATAAFVESIENDDYRTALQVLPFIPLENRSVQVRHYLEAACYFEMSNYAAAQKTLRRASTTLSEDIATWYPPSSKPLWKCCVSADAVVEDHLLSPKQSASGATCIRHRVSVLSREIEFMSVGSTASKYFTRDYRGISRSPVTMLLSLTINQNAILNDLSVDRSSTRDNFTALPLGNKTRVSVRLVQQMFRCILSGLYGDIKNVLKLLSFLETNTAGGRVWAMIGVKLREVLSAYYEMPPKNTEVVRSRIPTLAEGFLLEEEPVSSENKVLDNYVLWELTATAMTSLGESIMSIVTVPHTRRNPALSGIIAMSLCERAVGFKKHLRAACTALREFGKREPIYQHAYLLYDALCNSSSRNELLLKCCKECAATPALLEGPIFWKARALLVADQSPGVIDILHQLPSGYCPTSKDPQESRQQLVQQLSEEKTRKCFNFPDSWISVQQEL